MPYKINISEKNGKTYKLEADSESLAGIKIGEKVVGEDIDSKLSGYELEITGTSDKAGFPGLKNIEGFALKRVLLKKGTAMRAKKKGLRLKKTIRGNTISKDTMQINTKVLKRGNKKLEEIFPEQVKIKEGKISEQPTEQPTEQTAENKEK